MSLKNEIERSGREMTSPYNDGFTAFYHKQKILETLWECERWLKKSPTFADEDKWIAKHKPSDLND